MYALKRCTALFVTALAMTLNTAHAQKAGDAAADIRMAADAAPYRQFADQFVARAMAGDVGAVQAMISQQMQDRIGSAAVRRALDAQIVPFFAQGAQVGRSVTITRTTDAAGQQGFAFYMWLQPRSGGEARPFTVYVVDELGRRVVANIVPDRLVPGRHS
jgi:hypothetical protein